MKIGLALGSGSARGYAHIAVIEGLIKAGIKPNVISGSSAGAIVGAYYALHGEVSSLKRILMNFTRRDYLKLIDLNNPRKSLIKGIKLKQFMTEKFFGSKTFRSLKIPFFACATNYNRHKSVFLNHGKLIDAVMASICLPGVFPPYRIGRQVFIDGGALNPVPYDILLDEGCGRVIAVDINHFTFVRDETSLNTIPVLSNTFYMMLERISKAEAPNNVFIISPKFKPGFHEGLRFHTWRTYYSNGQREIKRVMPRLKNWLNT